MANDLLKKTLHFLGIVEQYDDDYGDLPPSATAPQTPAAAASRPEPSNVRRIPTADDGGVPAGPAATPPPAQPSGTVNVIGATGSTAADTPREPEPSGPSIVDHVHVTSPTAFNDVEEVGEQFRHGVPVLMNLQGASEGVAKRLLDFASGLIFGLDGGIERAGDRVFLLIPADTDVAVTEMDRLRERGLVQ
ncbi:cell division protein SepF [Euzebya tangerina]|uniref:cell division protein SepF n=1 Tax=Euzebya tangerina TaxID=591198 RepID=UPI000E31635F|nr:cell division protein SepF [Euzebya tangerina]